MNIAIFASGSGSNAENLIQYFDLHQTAKIVCVLTNKSDAFVLERVKKHNQNSKNIVDTKIFDRKMFYESQEILDYLSAHKIDFIVLAGFLWLVPDNLINAFPKKIINIHPALLPKYGGKGMYGMNVHKAVFENKETTTGITIHYANVVYDEGEVIFQISCDLTPNDTPEIIAQKIHALEHEYFPKVVEKVIVSNL